MARGERGSNPQLFDCRINIEGADAELVTKQVHAKMREDKRPSILNTVAAIIIEWAEKKSAKA